MIWTVISFNHTTEKMQCDLVESSMDFDRAYTEISHNTPNLVVSITKGSHVGATFIPDLDISLKRVQYNKNFKF